MTRVIVIVEGQTEEAFVAGPLYRYLVPFQVFLQPILIGVPGRKGGNVTFDRVVNDVMRTLQQDTNVVCSTLLDLYGLGRGFERFLPMHSADPNARASAIEEALKVELNRKLEDWTAQSRFIPYLQVHEFEGLLFSSPQVLAQAMFKPHLSIPLQKIRDAFASPEDINDGLQTAPSKRIQRLDTSYNKVVSGVLAAEQMGVRLIRQQCPRFNEWVAKLSEIQ